MQRTTKMNYIAELGQNHQGQIEIAKAMIDGLAGSGVRFIKSAKRDIDSFPDEWKNIKYDNPNSFGETYYDHRCALELSNDEWRELKRYAEFYGFEFMASFTDLASFEFLTQELELEWVKIASSRNQDKELLKAVRDWGGEVVVSCGMTSGSNVDHVANYLSTNLDLILLQCTSSYPCFHKYVNLSYAINAELDGISGHYRDTLPDMMAYTMGLRWFERHITLDKSMKGTDHQISLTPQEVKEFFKVCEQIDLIYGSNTKEILPCEQKTIKKLRYDLLH